ncbi:NAD/NADP transhydrogenase alpha subunit, partial [Angulomicrobium amanitiforme]|nr:NAD/NADP transhydrogenase alpha subunit [Ancylobacter amanitiformis]
MRLSVLRETAAVEPRVSASADTVKRYVGLGAEVVVASGAGVASGIGDGEYEGAGAVVVADNAAAVAGADIVLGVRRPEAGLVAGARRGAL